MTGRRCSRCFTLYPTRLIDRAFKLRGRDASRPRRSLATICRPCEQTVRDQKKRRNRFATKARDVIRRHAIRLGDRWADVRTPADLVRIYGWDPERLAHDAEFQYNNGCSYCGEQYREMGHGLADITLDVQDPSSPPFYRTNTKWCCQTCNRKKGALGPAEFEQDRQIYEIWSEQHTRNFDPLLDDPESLFYSADRRA